MLNDRRLEAPTARPSVTLARKERLTMTNQENPEITQPDTAETGRPNLTLVTSNVDIEYTEAAEVPEGKMAFMGPEQWTPEALSKIVARDYAQLSEGGTAATKTVVEGIKMITDVFNCMSDEEKKLFMIATALNGAGNAISEEYQKFLDSLEEV